MLIDDDSRAAQRLAGHAHQVGYVSGREPWREIIQWLTRGRFGRRRGWPTVPTLATPWQDTVSANRIGWRERAANLDGEVAFAVGLPVVSSEKTPLCCIRAGQLPCQPLGQRPTPRGCDQVIRCFYAAYYR
jgi:hypothetical protein